MALRGRLAAVRGAWLVFGDEAGFFMTLPQTKTRCTGRPDPEGVGPRPFPQTHFHRGSRFYRLHRDDGRRDGYQSLSCRDYHDLQIAA